MSQATGVRRRITVLTASFPPSFLHGGPPRSIGAMTQLLGDEFEISVITSARDGDENALMPGVSTDIWTEKLGARVCYLSTTRPSVRALCGRIAETHPDVLYLNSLFNFRYSIVPLALARLRYRGISVVLAPRGELSPGALGIRPRKKRLFLGAFRILGLHRYVNWHVSSTMEKSDVEREFLSATEGSRRRTAKRSLNISIALDPSPIVEADLPALSGPNSSEFSVVYLSRIVPKKNLFGLLQAFSKVDGEAILTIAGPVEDARYWAQCQNAIKVLPPGKSVRVVGPVNADDVVRFLSSFDLFVLPTMGENFGHVVLEALAAGVPVIVGEDTPWKAVEKSGAGMLCNPAEVDQLSQLIEVIRAESDEETRRRREAARRLAVQVMSDPATETANRDLFRSLPTAKR